MDDKKEGIKMIEIYDLSAKLEAIEDITKAMLAATIHDYDLSIVSLESQEMMESARIVGEKREFMQGLLDYFEEGTIVEEEEEEETPREE